MAQDSIRLILKELSLIYSIYQILMLFNIPNIDLIRNYEIF